MSKEINKFKQKKLIIFDMGNTLLHFHSGKNTDEEKDIIGLNRMLKFLYSNFKVKIELNEIKEEFLDKWYGDFHLRKEKLIELNVENYLKSFLNTKGIELSREESVCLMREFYSPYREQVIVGENAGEVLKKLKAKGYLIGVISNCILYDELYIEIFEEKKLKEYIDNFVFSYSNKVRKPISTLFIKMLNDLDIQADKAVMVGDGVEPDIKGAREVGIKGVWYNLKRISHSGISEDSECIEINDFNELLKLFE